jgi:hypothetical protein
MTTPGQHRTHPRAASLLWSATLCLHLLSTTPTAADDRDVNYQSLIANALEAQDQSRWSDSRSFFAGAHELRPSARTLRGLGHTSFMLGDYAAAVSYLSHALDSAVRPLPDDLRAKVRATLQDAKRRVASAHLQGLPAQAYVEVDGAPGVVSADGELLLNPGQRKLTIRVAGHDAIERSLQLTAGERVELALGLPLAAQPSDVARTVPDEHVSGGAQGPLPWIVIGSSLAIAGVGVVMVARALSDKSRVEHPAPNTPWRAVEEADARVRPWSTVGLVLLGVGIAGTAGGMAWKLWPAASDDKALSVTAGPEGVQMSGSF